jgi:hypothetical protein
MLTGNLNAEHPFWNFAVSNPSGEKLTALFYLNGFEISASLYPTHYCPAGNSDVLHIVIHHNIRVSNVIVSDNLNSDRLPIIFRILDHVKIRNLSETIEKFTDWDRFRNLASKLISPRIKIKSGVEADKSEGSFTPSIALACRL